MKKKTVENFLGDLSRRRGVAVSRSVFGAAVCILGLLAGSAVAAWGFGEFRAVGFRNAPVRQAAAEVAGRQAACAALDSSSVYLLRFLRSCM